MDRIVAPIKPQDNGPAVANLQQAMLLIVEKRQLSPDETLDQWKQVMSDELAQGVFGQHTIQLLLALLPALHLPEAEFVTPSVADALNKVLQDLGAFAPVPPPAFHPVVKWEYKIYSWKQPSGVLFRGAGAIPTDEIAAALNKLGNEGWEAVSVFPIAMGQGATNMVGILLKRAVPNG